MKKRKVVAGRQAGGRGALGVLAWVLLAVVFHSGSGPVLVAQEVTLPLPEYRSLRDRAYPPPEPPPEPPAPVAFEAATLDVIVGESSARVTYTLEISLYGDGWQAVPLPATGSFVAAELGGLEGRLAEGEERALLVRGEGTHRIALDAVLPLEADETATRPTWHLDLGLPAAALVSGTLTAPDRVVEVRASEGTVVRPVAGGGWSFVGSPGEVAELVLAGEATAPERSGLPLRFEATSAAALTLSHTRRRLQVWVEARVLQGELARLDLPVPDGLEVVSVDGPAVAGWDLQAGELRITPLVPVSDAFAVTVELAGPPVVELASPVVVPSGATRTLIATKVGVEGDGLLSLVDAGSGRRPDARQRERLPSLYRAASGEPLLVTEGTAPPRWSVTWAEGTEVLAAQVDRLLVHYLVGEAGLAHLELWATVRNSGAESLSLTLPPAAELLAARRDSVPLVPGKSAEGWVVPLAAGSEPQVVFVSALVPLALPRGDGELALVLPGLSAPASRVEVLAALPSGRSYRLAEGERVGRVSPPPQVAAQGESSDLARQLAGAGGAAATDPVRPAPVPAGFSRVEAVWSALSSAPPPVIVEVERERERRSWQ